MGEALGVDAGGDVKGDDSLVELVAWVGEESMIEAVKDTAWCMSECWVVSDLALVIMRSGGE